MDTPIAIPVSQITGFTAPPGLRYGQAIHQKLQLEKITSFDGKVWCDRLYVATDRIARQMVMEATDFLN